MKNILFAWGDLLVVITGISGHNCTIVANLFDTPDTQVMISGYIHHSPFTRPGKR